MGLSGSLTRGHRLLFHHSDGCIALGGIRQVDRMLELEHSEILKPILDFAGGGTEVQRGTGRGVGRM